MVRTLLKSVASNLATFILFICSFILGFHQSVPGDLCYLTCFAYGFLIFPFRLLWGRYLR